MKPPIFWRVVNAIRAWSESDDRLLVEQWKAAYAPTPKPKRHKNLMLVRSAHHVWEKREKQIA